MALEGRLLQVAVLIKVGCKIVGPDRDASIGEDMVYTTVQLLGLLEQRKLLGPLCYIGALERERGVREGVLRRLQVANNDRRSQSKQNLRRCKSYTGRAAWEWPWMSVCGLETPPALLVATNAYW